MQNIICGQHDPVHDITQLVEYENIGFYQFCKVTQIVLLDKKDPHHAINYFTCIEFNSEFRAPQTTQFKTKSPLSVNAQYKLGVSEYVISVDHFKQLYINAVPSQTWAYTDEKIDSPLELDNVFYASRKFIPGNDPSVSRYNLAVPLEKALFGSNFIGSYYLCELFSNKSTLSCLTDSDRITIQQQINKLHLGYDLIKLPDRIGNIVCKFEIETITATPKRLGAYNGIKEELALSKQCHQVHSFLLLYTQEHDGVVCNNSIQNINLAPGDVFSYETDSNECKNTTILVDTKTDLISFMSVRDYSQYRNYYAQIKPQFFAVSGATHQRTITVNGSPILIPLQLVSMLGEIYSFTEMYEVNERQEQWKHDFFKQHHYFKAYTGNSHTEAIQDIKDIINSELIWDLEEIWLIDPYLSPSDILETVVFCEKENISIKCITSIVTTKKNEETNPIKHGETSQGQNSSHKSDFDIIKEQYKEQLMRAIPSNTDMRLSYRTTHGIYGSPFHDRYLILKYGINRVRVWSLGISINSLGKSHHIIQIVEYPDLILDIFEEIWSNLDAEECKIFETTPVVSE